MYNLKIAELTGLSDIAQLSSAEIEEKIQNQIYYIEADVLALESDITSRKESLQCQTEYYESISTKNKENGKNEISFL